MVARRLVAPLAGGAEQAAARFPSISAACPSPAEKLSSALVLAAHFIVPPVHDCLELWSLGLYYLAYINTRRSHLAFFLCIRDVRARNVLLLKS